jgi:hypothetical protein
MRSRVKDYLGCGILAHGFARARDRYLDVQDRERAAGAVGARDADGSSEVKPPVHNGDCYTPYPPKYREEPSGRLSLVVRRSWGRAVDKSISDAGTRTLEDRLDEFMVLVVKVAHERAERERAGSRRQAVVARSRCPSCVRSCRVAARRGRDHGTAEQQVDGIVRGRAFSGSAKKRRLPVATIVVVKPSSRSSTERTTSRFLVVAGSAIRIGDRSALPWGWRRVAAARPFPRRPG